MPTKRAILAELTADELRAKLDDYELEVADRRIKARLAEALAASRKARLDEILQALLKREWVGLSPIGGWCVRRGSYGTAGVSTRCARSPLRFDPVG